MKKILSLVLCVVLLTVSLPCTVFSVSDDIVKTGGIEYRIVDDGQSAMVIGYYGSRYTSKVVIPSEVNGIPVTVIAWGAFYDKDFIKEVVISEGIEAIGSEAFSINDLESITIPSTVTSIRESAFSGCRNLKKLYISDIASLCNLKVEEEEGYSIGLQYISELYLNGERIHSIVLPKGLTAINNVILSKILNSVDVLVVPASVDYLGENSVSTYTNNKIFYLGTAEEWAEIEGVSDACGIEYRKNIVKGVTMDEDGWLYKKQRMEPRLRYITIAAVKRK